MLLSHGVLDVLLYVPPLRVVLRKGLLMLVLALGEAGLALALGTVINEEVVKVSTPKSVVLVSTLPLDP
jgi:hypothetical protein